MFLIFFLSITLPPITTRKLHLPPSPRFRLNFYIFLQHEEQRRQQKTQSCLKLDFPFGKRNHTHNVMIEKNNTPNPSIVPRYYLPNVRFLPPAQITPLPSCKSIIGFQVLGSISIRFVSVIA